MINTNDNSHMPFLITFLDTLPDDFIGETKCHGFVPSTPTHGSHAQNIREYELEAPLLSISLMSTAVHRE